MSAAIETVILLVTWGYPAESGRPDRRYRVVVRPEAVDGLHPYDHPQHPRAAVELQGKDLAGDPAWQPNDEALASSTILGCAFMRLAAAAARIGERLEPVLDLKNGRAVIDLGRFTADGTNSLSPREPRIVRAVFDGCEYQVPVGDETPVRTLRDYVLSQHLGMVPAHASEWTVHPGALDAALDEDSVVGPHLSSVAIRRRDAGRRKITAIVGGHEHQLSVLPSTTVRDIRDRALREIMGTWRGDWMVIAGQGEPIEGAELDEKGSIGPRINRIVITQRAGSAG